MNRKIIKIIFSLIIIILLTGCSEEKVYKNKGIQITMDKGLFYKNHDNATIYYENENIFIIGLKEKFEDLYELDINHETSIERYANEVFINREESFDLIKDENLYYYTYEYEGYENTYYYISTIHKSDDAFWICNFVCKKEDKEKYHDLFIKWGKSVKFY